MLTISALIKKAQTHNGHINGGLNLVRATKVANVKR